MFENLDFAIPNKNGLKLVYYLAMPVLGCCARLVMPSYCPGPKNDPKVLAYSILILLRNAPIFLNKYYLNFRAGYF